MIRYNVNAPEIKDLPQYNVMRGFSYWCIVFEAFAFLWMLIAGYFLNQYWIDMPVTVIVALIVLIISFGLSALLACGIGFGIIKSNEKSSNIIRLFCNIGIILCVVEALYPVVQSSIISSDPRANKDLWFFYSTYPIVFSIVRNALLIYCFHIIKKTIAQPCVNLYLSSGMKIEPVYNTHCVNDTITWFDAWSPLNGYGRLLFYAGLSGVASIVMLLFGLHTLEGKIYLPDTLHSMKWGVLLSVQYFLLMAIGGYGLSKQKEWGRILTLIAHFIFLLFPILFFLLCLSLSNRLVDLLSSGVSMLFCFIILFPYMHWCYFVIRTLTSPVVKYVCLRGGQDIESILKEQI